MAKEIMKTVPLPEGVGWIDEMQSRFGPFRPRVVVSSMARVYVDVGLAFGGTSESAVVLDGLEHVDVEEIVEGVSVDDGLTDPHTKYLRSLQMTGRVLSGVILPKSRSKSKSGLCPGEKCDRCDHLFSEFHRVVPETWGGLYEQRNVVSLCPNHHSAIHFMMTWYKGKPPREGREEDRLLSYMADRAFMRLWNGRIKPVVIGRLVAEGRRAFP